MDLELIREVLIKFSDFQKPNSSNPLAWFRAIGLVNYEGEQWVKRIKLLNPAFHQHTLKVLPYYPHYVFFSIFFLLLWAVPLSSFLNLREWLVGKFSSMCN